MENQTPNPNVTRNINEQISRGAYIAALKALHNEKHPVLVELLPRVHVNTTSTSEQKVISTLSTDEILILKRFVYRKRVTMLIQASVILGFSIFSFVLAGDSVLSVVLGKGTILNSIVPCCVGVICIPCFGLGSYQIGQILLSETYGIF